MLAKGEEYF